MKTLIAKELVFKSEKEYMVYDRFLDLWLKREYQYPFSLCRSRHFMDKPLPLQHFDAHMDLLLVVSLRVNPADTAFEDIVPTHL